MATTSDKPMTLELPDLTPDLYINRELSWLDFNCRVLQEAEEEATPLLERVKFAAIFSSNLDEFFMIRVAGVKRKVVANVTDAGIDGRTPVEVLRAISQRVQQLLTRQARDVQEQLFPALARVGIEVVSYDQLPTDQKSALEKVFEREVFPVLTPQAIDRGRRFPHISNDSLNLIVVLKSKGESRFARVKVPALLPRFVPVPLTEPEGESGTVLANSYPDQPGIQRYVPLEQLIAAHMDRLFPGAKVVASYPFHLIRDSDVEPDEDDEESQNLLEVMKETISQRPFGTTVRIDVDASMPKAVRTWLVDQVHGTMMDVYVIDGLLGLEDLFQLTGINRPDLKDVPMEPSTNFPWRDEHFQESGGNIFDIIRKQDVLVHHPYQSFGAVVDFVGQASRDPDVVAIKQTLYRLGKNSPLIPCLIAARDDDTQVAVLVELKARFDEENNIEWAQTLETRGVHVAYGLAGLKTHSKLTMVVRREPDGLRRYCHIGTGNYNAGTARIYEDLGLFTASDAIADDVTDVFNVLTGYADQREYTRLWVAPHAMRTRLIESIVAEVESHNQHGNGHIILKMNSLVDKETIRALYAASQAGVKVDLIIRGICCLRPGVKGVSETVTVRSIVGRYLEHSRIYYFANNSKARVFIGSADAMERNFDRRVEVITPVESEALVQHIREDIIDMYWRDSENARELRSDGSWGRVYPPEGEVPFDVQAAFTRYYRKNIALG
ncbi:MAG: polyphosphate kinase 1 [Thermomicrobiales bacterium]|nr:polyphosphate kinase 1 [Thermomicrobiales bacterium]MCO5227878.1 polyphosphate kinase 1 [Thermomicrobiales bacterium]